MADEARIQRSQLLPLPYQQALVEYLSTHEPEVWAWAASAEAREEHAQAMRAQLLQSAYRLDAEAHPEPHTYAKLAAERLGVTASITLYQSGGEAMNASIFCLPGEAHILLSGPLLERLHGIELQAVLGHELSHHLLWTLDGGAFHVDDRVLQGCAADGRSAVSHLNSARLYGLYTEAFADRGACVACGALEPAVAALVKVETGLANVSAASYLKQADEICTASNLKTKGASHPETFVRARALRLWTEGADDTESWLSAMLEGPLSLDTLDLLGQQRLTRLTRQTIDHLLQRPFLQSEALLAHARRYFPDYAPPTAAMPEAEPVSAGVHDYLAYVLIDFVAADADQDDITLAAALGIADTMGFGERLELQVVKDMRFPKRSLTRVKRDAAQLIEKAAT